MHDNDKICRILLIIPAYNEEKSILKTVHQIESFREHSEDTCVIRYVVINDGSKDDTRRVLEENRIPHIDLLHNLGIGGAVQTGYKYAFEHDYDIAIQFDGDGQHDANYIPNIIAPLLNDESDLCIGSRFVADLSKFKSTKMRRVGINIISRLIRICSGQIIKDPTSGFRAANRKVIAYFSKNYPSEYPEPESIIDLARYGLRVTECPVVMHERAEGESSIKAWSSVYYMINVCLSIMITSIKRKGSL